MAVLDDNALREMFPRVSREEWLDLARARELAHWTETNRFCGKCGTAMVRHPDPAERAMKCPACGYLAYPHITTAVIALKTSSSSRSCG